MKSAPVGSAATSSPWFRKDWVRRGFRLAFATSRLSSLAQRDSRGWPAISGRAVDSESKRLLFGFNAHLRHYPILRQSIAVRFCGPVFS